jgi:tetratricopeptide (TPR) repeat protein
MEIIRHLANGFSCRLPEVHPRPGEIISIEECERRLLLLLAESKPTLEGALWELVRFYMETRNMESTLEFVGRIEESFHDDETLAQCGLVRGQNMEKKEDYSAAIVHYARGLSLQPHEPFTCYFLNNNMGYSLIQLKQYEQAEAYCRAAIRLDPSRSNGHKNLGLALLGLDDVPGAVESWINATKADAADPRSLRHLEKILAARPELLIQKQELASQLDQCRQAVVTARMLAAHVTHEFIDSASSSP